jgi:hypothetical protein
MVSVMAWLRFTHGIHYTGGWVGLRACLDTEGRGKIMIRPTELSDNPTSSYLVANREELNEKMMNLALKIYLFILRSDFYML